MDIKKINFANTLDTNFYKSNDEFENSKENIFAQSWQLSLDLDNLQLNNTTYPTTILDGFLNEPVMFSMDNKGKIRALSNVCTHRGNILAQFPQSAKKIRCGYHGRTFDLSGKMLFMPEFKDAQNFPSESDNLHNIPMEIWSNKFAFLSINPKFDFKNVIEIMQQKIGFLPLEEFRFSPEKSKDYLVNCHWALYCENYLEGFHIPFVHPDLNAALDYNEYSTILYDYCNLQIGIGNSGDFCFDLPEGHEDFGKQIAAYYYWVFPNMMFNFYPWGLSINIVKPINPKLTRVSFLTYIYDESKLDSGAGALLDKVEREDESVVESVQKGIMSRFYKSGRYSPKMEKGVYHFHQLIKEFQDIE